MILAPDHQGSSPKRLGRYELIRRLGVGGMAEVFLARQRGFMNFRKLVVVKTIHPTLSTDPEFVNMLLDEARLAALIRHPRVVDIYDLGVEGDTYYLAMEYLPGKPLTDVIRTGLRHKKIDIHSSARIIADAAEGLHAAHELKSHAGEVLDFVHRDVSPGNVMVLYDGQVKLVDFGIAKARGRLQKTAIQNVKGKLGYASPEQLDTGRVDRRSDVFSLGVCMWEFLTHRRLFQADSVDAMLKLIRKAEAKPPSLVRPDVPRELDEICSRALRLNPKMRYQSAKEMQKEIESFLRVENYYRESNAIGNYMEEMFSDDRKADEDIVRQVAEGTAQIDLGSVVDDEPDEDVTYESEDVSPLIPRPPVLPPSAAPAAQRSDTDVDGTVVDEEAQTDVRVPNPPVQKPGAVLETRSLFGAKQSEGAPAIEPLQEKAEPTRVDPIAGDPAAPKYVRRDETQVVRPFEGGLSDRQRRLLWIGLAVTGTLALIVAVAIGSSGGELPEKNHGERGAKAALLAGMGGEEEGLSEPEPEPEPEPETDVEGLTESGATAAEQQPAAEREAAEREAAEREAAEREAAEREAAEREAAEREAAEREAAEREAAEREAAEREAAEREAAEREAAEREAAERRAAQERQEAAAKRQAAAAKRQAAAERRAAARGEAAARRQAAAERRARLQRLKAQAKSAYDEGFRLFVRGSSAAAEKKFREALRLRPGYPLPHRGLGMLYQKRGQTKRAVREFRLYLRGAPRAGDAGQIKQRIEKLRSR